MSDYAGMARNAEELAVKRKRGGTRAHEMAERGRKGARARGRDGIRWIRTCPRSRMPKGG